VSAKLGEAAPREAVEGAGESKDLVEIKRLRVDPAARRAGIGRRLSEVAVNWCGDRRFGAAILKTSAAQLPAIALYEKLAFREVGRTFSGKSEWVWPERELSLRERTPLIG